MICHKFRQVMYAFLKEYVGDRSLFMKAPAKTGAFYNLQVIVGVVFLYGHYKSIIIVVVLSVFLVAICSSALAIKNAPGIAYGVHSGDVDLAGLDERTAAKNISEKFMKETENGVIILNYDGKSWTIKPDDIALICDNGKTAEMAAAVGVSGNFFKDVFDKFICTYQGKNVPLQITYDQNKLNSIITRLASSINKEPVDAYAYTDGTAVGIKGEKEGKKIDEKQLTDIINEKIESGIYPQTLDIPVSITKAAVEAGALEQIDTVLAAYTTHFNTGDVNRSANVALAAKNLSGTLLTSGTVFSFNKTVGPRLAAAGYREAPEIINGKVVPGIGGGVCQVSSTLYNSILQAGLTPVERTEHYLPVDYVPRAFDATVADGFIDFKFRNNLKHSVYISTRTENGALTIFIIGSSDDKAQAAGITLKNYYNGDGSVSAYRIYRQNGNIAKKEFLHTDN